MIEAVIERLKEFAHQDFPVPEVSSYLLKKIIIREIRYIKIQTLN